MKAGDIVRVPRGPAGWTEGLIVGFGEKGEGGKDYVKVLVDGNIEIYMSFNIEVIDEI
tara:strand:- start:4007 stop:4180 length:174 start_codon:yes stop_codon:yes gene_type:complete